MKKLLLVFIALFALTTVLAQVEIDDLDSPFFVKPGEIVKARVYLDNSGDSIERVYTDIEVVGKNYFHEYKTAPVIVKQGRDATMSIYFKAPERPGEYRLYVEAYNEDIDFEDKFRFEVIEETEDFEATLCSDEPVLDRNSANAVKICIANMGTEMDDFSIKVEDWENYLLSDNLINLDSSSQEVVTINVNSDPSINVGDYNMVVLIKSIRSGEEREITVPIHILGSDKDKTDINTNITTTSSIVGDSIMLNLTVLNKGLPNLYYVEVNYSSNWTGAEIKPFNVFLRTNEFREYSLEFTPKNEGSYPTSIIVSTEEGIIYTKDFRITSFQEQGGVGITGAFLRIGEGKAPLYIFLVLAVLVVAFLGITYIVNEKYYYIQPTHKDKDIKIELQ